MAMKWLTNFAGNEWAGTGELWLDPEGNNVDRSDCTLRIETGVLHYTWSYEGKSKEGSFTFEDGGATWTDSWHQPEPIKCTDVRNARGVCMVKHACQVP